MPWRLIVLSAEKRLKRSNSSLLPRVRSKKNRDSPAATINALLKSMAGAIFTSLPPEPVGRPKEFRRSLSSPSGAWFAGSLSTAAMLKENDGAAWLQSLGVRHIVIAGMENIAAPSGRF
jgi:hypothetical protein